MLFTRQFFHGLARETIYNARFPLRVPDEAYQVFVHVLGLGPHFVVEVGAVERRLEHLRLQHAQVFLYVVLHFGRCSRGQGHYRRAAYALRHALYVPVLGAEVVPPLGYAVGLVHGVEAYLNAFQEVHVLRLVQRLGGEIQQLGLPLQHILLHGGYLGARQRRVDEVRYAVLVRVVAHSVHLVLHQRYQGGYHYRHAVHQQRRELVAQALAAARRHQHKRIFPVHHAVDDGFLGPLESVKTEIMLQRSNKFLVSCHSLSFVISGNILVSCCQFSRKGSVFFCILQIF